MQDRPQELQILTMFLKKYVYSSELGTFVAVPAMPSHLPAQIVRSLDALRLIEKGILAVDTSCVGWSGNSDHTLGYRVY